MKTEPVKEEEKKKKKTPEQTKPMKEEEGKKKEPNGQPRKRKEKKKKSKGAAEYCLWVPYVCLITILLLSYELWKLKTAKMCF